MNIKILGKNPDDKGTQLEILSSKILQSYGYSTNLNKISYGGSEIDVCGSLGQERIIYECKATNKPINITDWLKFVGKIYSERQINNGTKGVLIALSGVNGNVRGHFEQLSTKDDSFVNLIEQDKLLEFLKSEYNFQNEYVIHKRLQSLTSKKIATIDVAYYDNEVYLVIYFKDNSFSVLDYMVSSIPETTIVELVEIECGKEFLYFDISKEVEFIHRKSVLSKIIIFCIINNNFDMFEIQKTINDFLMESVSESEILKIATAIPIIQINQKHLSFKELDIDDKVIFYRTVLDGMLFIPIFETDFYLSSIDNSLLDKILEIQGGISIKPNDYAELLKVVKVSPFALQYAIFEDFTITRYRSNGKPLLAYCGNQIDKAHSQMFYENIISYFVKNLSDANFNELYKTQYHLSKFDEKYSIEAKIGSHDIVLNKISNRVLAKIDNVGDGTMTTSVVLIND